MSEIVETLPASAYRPMDRVIGVDGEASYFGTVSEHQSEQRAAEGNVLVYWSDMTYVQGSQGHVAPAEALRLWPSQAHAHRLAELARAKGG